MILKIHRGFQKLLHPVFYLVHRTGVVVNEQGESEHPSGFRLDEAGQAFYLIQRAGLCENLAVGFPREKHLLQRATLPGNRQGIKIIFKVFFIH